MQERERGTGESAALPAPFEAMNAPAPVCEASGCGTLVALEHDSEGRPLTAHTVVGAVARMWGMDEALPKGVDWMVLGARDTDGCHQITTVGNAERDAPERAEVIEGALDALLHAYRIPDAWAQAMMPAPIHELFIVAVMRTHDGARRYVAVARLAPELEAERQRELAREA